MEKKLKKFGNAKSWIRNIGRSKSYIRQSKCIKCFGIETLFFMLVIGVGIAKETT